MPGGQRTPTKLALNTRVTLTANTSMTLAALIAAGNPAIASVPDWANAVSIVPEDPNDVIRFTMDGVTAASATTELLLTGRQFSDLHSTVIARIRLYCQAGAYLGIELLGY
jgi:hypothetical protein